MISMVEQKKRFPLFQLRFFKTYLLIHFWSVFPFLILGKHQKTYYFLSFSEACNFFKKQTQVQMFFCEFCGNFENNFLTEYLWSTASVINISIVQIQGCINKMILSNTEPAFTCSQLTAETREQCAKSVFKVRSSHPEVFLEISQISQQNICASVSFLIKLQTSACNFIKKVTLAQVLSCEFYEVIDVVQLPLL